MRRVAVVGGGIAGLAVAHALRARLEAAGARIGAEILVLEKSSRPGGNIRTEMIDGFACEWGPNGFLDSIAETLALARAAGLESRVLPSNDAARRRFLYRRGRLHELPTGPAAFLASGLLSAVGKARILWEPFARRRPPGDETIHDFAARRIGREAASVLIDAMVSGIFGGDAKRLSLEACFPTMRRMEDEHGGLFRALLARRSRKRSGQGLGAPAGRLTSFAGGMEELPRALAGTLGDAVRTGAAVLKIGTLDADAVTRADPGDATSQVSLGSKASAPKPHGAASGEGTKVGESPPLFSPIRRFLLELASGERIAADAVVLAGSAAESARIVTDLDPELARALAAIPTAPIAVVALGYDAAALGQPLDGFGFLVPRGEGIRILGVLWDSSIFPGRAPAGRALLRAMIGGAHDPEAVSLPETTLVEIVRSELARTMGITAPPVLAAVFRHPLGIPQYTVGHLERLAWIETRLAGHPGLFLAGNSYRGVAINSCIVDASPLAARILGALGAAGA